MFRIDAKKILLPFRFISLRSENEGRTLVLMPRSLELLGYLPDFLDSAKRARVRLHNFQGFHRRAPLSLGWTLWHYFWNMDVLKCRLRLLMHRLCILLILHPPPPSFFTGYWTYHSKQGQGMNNGLLLTSGHGWWPSCWLAWEQPRSLGSLPGCPHYVEVDQPQVHVLVRFRVTSVICIYRSHPL